MQIIELISRDRIRAVCVSIIIVTAILLAVSLFSKDPDLGADFAAFYNAGDGLNHGLKLYQPEAIAELTTNAPLGSTLLPFLNPPFFALPFRVLALLPYRAAYGLWLLIATSVYVAGFLILWPATRLPEKLKIDALLLILAFVPFQIYVLAGGQQSWFGFFWLALTFRLEFHKRDFLAGLALSVCLYKPVLLIIILPSLLLRGRFRLLTGFAVGALALGLFSIAAVGVDGCADYVRTMLIAIGSKTSVASVFPTWKYVDIVSFSSLLVHRQVGVWLLALAFIAVLSRRPNLTEAAAWTTPINIYTPMYDVALIGIPALLTYTERRKSMYCALFFAPWISEISARLIGFQVMTVLLLAFAFHVRTVLKPHKDIQDAVGA